MTTSTALAGTRNITLLAGGALALAAVGLAAGMALHSPSATAETAATAGIEAQPQKAAAAPAKAPRAPVAQRAAQNNEGGRSQPAARPVANACANCGIVEGVRSFEKKGEGSGLGAVAGGVLGGALGNQVGKGNGRSAMTVIGVVGGGLAGHEIEKRAKSETLYEVRVRMDDGALRTLTQKTAPAPGARVVVEGETLGSAEGSKAVDEPRVVRTSSRGN